MREGWPPEALHTGRVIRRYFDPSLRHERICIRVDGGRIATYEAPVDRFVLLLSEEVSPMPAKKTAAKPTKKTTATKRVTKSPKAAAPRVGRVKKTASKK